ncbi:HAD domain-containing protein [Streptomyces sp. NPDC057621]|uniref:HAD domain-containing protein n=1 Tax=Streptomyces sp. NPDC057621 TaxID=3346186 RepID=UPI0036C9A8EA
MNDRCEDGRPVLFLDIDGPLIPFGPSAGGRPGPPASSASGNPLLGRLDPAVGPRLLALGCELVWASTWLDDANEVVASRIGLPALPVVRWQDAPADAVSSATAADGVPRGLHWKTRHILDRAGRRPFIWVDDEIGALDRLWVDAQRREPSLLHRVDPGVGLVDADFAVLAEWLRSVGQQGVS